MADTTGGDLMTPEQAAWVREYVWRPSWLRHYQETPGPFTDCACQKPPPVECQTGRHGACRHDGHPINEAVIATSQGRAARFPEPYEHRTPAGQHGRRLAHGTNDVAWVWLAGMPCHEVCNCGCHRPGSAPPDETTVAVESVQIGIWASATIPAAAEQHQEHAALAVR